MSSPARILILDFDGTAVLEDVGDRIVEELCPDGRRLVADLNAEVDAGRLSLQGLQERLWPLVRVDESALDALLDAVAPRPGLRELVEAAPRWGAEVRILSGGFDLYIARILLRLGPPLAGLPVTANRMARRGDRLEIAFPHGIPCSRCALCKGKVLEPLRAAGSELAFCGDGSSDRCALPLAHHAFCVAGSSLERVAARTGARATPFTHFDVVRARLDEVWGR